MTTITPPPAPLEREARTMSVTVEKLMPWSGAVAGLCWVAQDALRHTSADDRPGGTSLPVIRDHLALNYGSQGCLVVMGVALLCFATAVRALLRSGESRESSYSSVAFGGWLVVVASLSQMVVWNWGLINGAIHPQRHQTAAAPALSDHRHQRHEADVRPRHRRRPASHPQRDPRERTHALSG